MNESIALLEDYFPNRINGNFLDTGAHGGTPSYSHSWLFEVEKGWRGLLVEPSCTYCDLVRNRPRAHTVKAALCRPVGSRQTFRVPCDSELGRIQMTRSGIVQNLSAMAKFAMWAAGSYDYPVECASVETLLLAANIKTVDLWTLDVEGVEADVLRSLTGRVAFHVIMVETMPTLPQHAVRRNRTTAAMRWLGMTLDKTSGYDDFWVNTSFVPSAHVDAWEPQHLPPHCPTECMRGSRYSKVCANFQREKDRHNKMRRK